MEFWHVKSHDCKPAFDLSKMATQKSEKSIVVIDPGSGTFKMGEAGAFVPRVVFDSVVGKPKLPGKFRLENLK